MSTSTFIPSYTNNPSTTCSNGKSSKKGHNRARAYKSTNKVNRNRGSEPNNFGAQAPSKFLNSK